jgi:hypothetical protein
MPITVAGTNITMNDSTVQATAFLGMRATVFTANGTFTIPTGITAIKITVVGGGGGSGGGGSGGCCASYLGGAGAGGGAAIKYLTNVQNLNKRGDKRYVAFTKGKLQVGDVFCGKRTKGGHTGIIVQILDEKTNYCETVEGNTDSSKTGEGDKAKKLKRYLTVGKNNSGLTIVGFFRRNFTEEELKKIRYDETKQTYVFDV